MRPYAPLSREEEQRLARLWRDEGDAKARETIILAHMPLARAFAYRVRAFGIPREDLVQQAVLGMCKGIDEFDLDRGVRFSTFARWWMRAYVDEFIRYRARVVRPVGKPPKQRRELASINVVSFDFRIPTKDGEGSTLADLIPDGKPLPDELAEIAVDHGPTGLLHRALAKLDARARGILARRFGDEEATLQKCSDDLGISKERVRQIESQAIEKLRKWMEVPA